MTRPGIEPGSVPWQGTILPLDHRVFSARDPLVSEWLARWEQDGIHEINFRVFFRKLSVRWKWNEPFFPGERVRRARSGWFLNPRILDTGYPVFSIREFNFNLRILVADIRLNQE